MIFNQEGFSTAFTYKVIKYHKKITRLDYQFLYFDVIKPSENKLCHRQGAVSSTPNILPQP